MPGETVPTTATNTTPGDLGQSVRLLTNSFGIGVLDDTVVFAYDVNICYQSRNGKTVVITKKGKDELVFNCSCRTVAYFSYIVNSRKEQAIKAYRHLLQTYTSFFGLPHACWYDGQSLLFSKKNFFEDVHENKWRHFDVEGGILDESLSQTTVSFDVKPSARASVCVS